jgi:integrase
MVHEARDGLISTWSLLTARHRTQIAAPQRRRLNDREWREDPDGNARDVVLNACGTPRGSGGNPTADRVIAKAPVASTRLADLRDRALLLLGFAGAFRRSELVALDIEDIEETKDGLRAMIRRGKTDQEGKGAMIAIVRGAVVWPVAAYRAWIEAANISTGPVFRPIAKGQRLQEARLTDRSVAKIVKAHAARIGLDPAVFSGHSLRSAFLTSAAARGASIFKMMDVSRHKRMDTLRGYIRDAEHSGITQGRVFSKAP